jgi:hypothetical protein
MKGHGDASDTEVVMAKFFRNLFPLAAAAGVALPLLLAPSPAAAQSCEDLWYERNSIYKSAGYCFKTRRAISAFGNAGCIYDRQEDVPLSASERRRVDAIVRQERAYACPR